MNDLVRRAVAGHRARRTLELDDVVERFVDERGSSLVVVDDDDRPIGRILADDLVDALAPQSRVQVRRRLPRSTHERAVAPSDADARPPSASPAPRVRARGCAQPRVAARLSRLLVVIGPGLDRGQRRQRRRRHRHLRVGRRAVRLPHAVRHGAHRRSRS